MTLWRLPLPKCGMASGPSVVLQGQRAALYTTASPWRWNIMTPWTNGVLHMFGVVIHFAKGDNTSCIVNYKIHRTPLVGYFCYRVSSLKQISIRCHKGSVLFCSNLYFSWYNQTQNLANKKQSRYGCKSKYSHSHSFPWTKADVDALPAVKKLGHKHVYTNSSTWVIQ